LNHLSLYFYEILSGIRWYLIVIVLLYIGLLTSFSLNVSLLLRREPPPMVSFQGRALLIK
jgi:hypothetical protein